MIEVPMPISSVPWAMLVRTVTASRPHVSGSHARS